MVTNPRRAVSRVDAAQIVRDATWPGTEVMSQQLLDDSVGAVTWRASRAGLLRATEEPRIWMTPAEFGGWITAQTDAWKRRVKAGAAEPKPLDAVGITNGTGGSRKLRLLRGERQVSKIEALAMAHYAFQFPVPTPAGDVEAFGVWFRERFGPASDIARWLECTPNHILDRLRGYDLRGDGAGRHPRVPEAMLIRALDWVWRVGPFCPYGDPTGIPVWPGQEVC